MCLRVHPAARKHGVGDEDIHHAMRHAHLIADIDGDDDKVLVIGPDTAGNLLEVVERSGLVIHAMPLRKSYEPRLRGRGGDHG